ncbi:MAG: SDR family oxidoreductase [Hymenobacteraceae bacterium]|nr:SDR family oxidoreductase [Hymenobacteraceae bacterium]
MLAPTSQQKYILVTGGTRGIGRAVARRFVAEGFGLLTCARSAPDLAQLRADLTTEFPGAEVRTHVADLSEPAQTAAFGAWVVGEGRVPDVVVHNTGVFVPGRIQDEPEGALRLLLETNVTSAYDLTRAVLPAMLARRSGHFFTICSTASLMAYPAGGSYCISKFALLGFTKVLREELKPSGLRVTAILPGATLTDSWAGANLPPDRLMPPEDVADAVWAAWAASPRTVIEEVLLRPQLGDLP